MGWGGNKMKLRKLGHGDTLTVRITKDVPAEVYEYINILREQGRGGNKELLQYLAEGIRAEMEPEEERISIYIEGLTKEEKKRIESNPEMMALLQNLIKASLNKKREW